MSVQGKRQWQPRMVQVLHLEAMVPPDHMLRRIDAVLDLSFVRQRVAHLYSADHGRPSFPPELIMRMLLLEYLYNLSDVRLCEDVSMHAGFRWFCRLNFDDPVPDRTTLVKVRKRWAADGVFDDLLRQVVQQCIDAGLVTGRTLAVDGTQVTANAAHKSLAPLAPVETLDDYLKRVQEADRDDSDDDPMPPAPPRQGGDPDFHGERFSNQTHRSTTDRDARLFKKGPGQEAKLRYMAHDLIDVTSGVILTTKATLATSFAERTAGVELLDQALPLLPQTFAERWLLGDKGYRGGEFFAQVLERGVLPGVDLDRTLEPEPTWKVRPRTLVEARARRRRRRLVAARNRVRSFQSVRLNRRLRRARLRVEHVFAEAKIAHGLDRARSRGLQALHTQAVLTAIVQNLKRRAMWKPRSLPNQGILAVFGFRFSFPWLTPNPA